MNLFASTDQAVRQAAAEEIIAERLVELTQVELALAAEADGWLRKGLRNRVKGLKNNITSWQDYIAEDCPREVRATTRPGDRC
ncbi:hypothetical protein [Nonomuraea typhae]|uniref:hypothetical protein n=1 Tax=Nonomuraea typhae TaxID=2603600 RepID=UPI0012FBE950|nr:hypothetical protein [Nonomuraea typhae]